MEKTNEIDLIEIFVKIFLFFKRYKYLFLIGIILGILISFLKISLETKYYTSHITVESNQKEALISIIESANELKDYSLLLKDFKFDTETSNKIKEIEIKRLFYGEGEKKGEFGSFKVYFTVTDTSVFKNIEEGLMYYTNNNEYFKELNKLYYLQRIELIKKYEEEINELDSLRKTGNGKSLILSKDAETNFEIINLFKEKQGEELALKVSRPLTIVKSFEPARVQSNSKTKSFAIIIGISFFLSFILATLFESNSFAKKYYKKNI